MEQLERKTRGESEVSKSIKREIEALSSDQQKNLLIELINEHQGRISSLLYFAKLWSSEGIDPDLLEMEKMQKNIRSYQSIIKRSGDNEGIKMLISQTEIQIKQLEQKIEAKENTSSI